MLYLYDNAIAEDLQRSFNPTSQLNPEVKVVDPEGVISLIAQMQEDRISFPIVVLTRHEDTPIDNTRTNFTRMHRGIATVIDPDTNELYYEKVIPIKLSYDLTILATNTADMDELVKELLFKYLSMYFIKFQLPYECRRPVRFGVSVDPETEISRKSGQFEYIDGGTLHQAIITLKCEGAVLVSYTPVKLKRGVQDVEIVNPH